MGPQQLQHQRRRKTLLQFLWNQRAECQLGADERHGQYEFQILCLGEHLQAGWQFLNSITCYTSSSSCELHLRAYRKRAHTACRSYPPSRRRWHHCDAFRDLTGTLTSGACPLSTDGVGSKRHSQLTTTATQTISLTVSSITVDASHLVICLRLQSPAADSSGSASSSASFL